MNYFTQERVMNAMPMMKLIATMNNLEILNPREAKIVVRIYMAGLN